MHHTDFNDFQVILNTKTFCKEMYENNIQSNLCHCHSLENGNKICQKVETRDKLCQNKFILIVSNNYNRKLCNDYNPPKIIQLLNLSTQLDSTNLSQPIR